MSTSTIHPRFYPNLGSVIDLDKLPEVFDDLNATEQLKELLGKIFFKDLQYSKSDTKDAAFYSLSLIARERLALDLPGLGISFVLNPDLSATPDSNVSVFPVTFDYEWKILGLIRSFNPSWVSFGDGLDHNDKIAKLFEFALRALNLTEEQVMAHFVNSFTDPSLETESVLEQFVNKLNTYFSDNDITDGNGIQASLAAPNDDTTLKSLTQEIYTVTESQYASIMAMGAFLLTSDDVEVNRQSVKSFFRGFLPQDIESYLKDMLLPKFSCSLQLSAGIEFPRSILKPVYLENGTNPYNPGAPNGNPLEVIPEVDGEPKTLIKAAQWDINFSTEGGFGSKLEVVLSTPLPAQIGDSNVVLHIESLSVPINIQGVRQPAHFDGKVYFTKDDGSQPDIIDVKFDVYENGFNADVKSINGVALVDIDREKIKVGVILHKLGIKKEGDDYEYSVGGKITTDIDIPKIGKVFPSLIDVKQVTIKTAEPDTYNIEMMWPGGTKVVMSDSEPFSGYLPWGLTGDNALITMDGIKFNVRNLENPEGLAFASEFKNLVINLKIVKGTIDGMGVDMIVSKPDDPAEANLGRLRVGLGFNPPEGIGIESGHPQTNFYINGYLHLDQDNQRYWGYLRLKFKLLEKSIDIAAVGVYQENLPDGSEGNSFLCLVSFILPKPIPLFFGFKLKAIGGIVGTNRTIDTDVIISQVRAGTIGNVMFPNIGPELSLSALEDEIEESTEEQNSNDLIEGNYENIIASLESVFPIEPGRNSFGLLFKLENGPLVLDAGILISLPKPVVFGLIGLIKIEKGRKVTLKVAFSILVDFGKKLISIDAAIFDSKIGKIVVDGEMAARIGWGDNKQFLVSVGGFHPNYSTDQFTLPELKRVAMIIKDEPYLKLKAEAYVAVCSNAVMFGARVDVLILSERLDKLKVEAYAGLDALFMFNPFRFEVDVYAGAAIFWNNKEVLSVSLGIYLKGPGAWHAKGHAEFVILKLKVRAEFDKQFGQAEDDSLPAVNPIPLLLEELEKDDNWTSSSPLDGSVVIKELPEGSEEKVVSADGNIRLEQLLLPLGITVEKIADSPVTSPTLVNVASVQLASGVGGTVSFTDQTAVDREDYFAPANYIKLSDQEKLEAKSFELMQSGVDIQSGEGWSSSAHAVEQVQEYEVQEATAEGETLGDPLGTISHDRLSAVNKPLGGQFNSNQNFRKSRRARRNKIVRITQPEYVLLNDLGEEVSRSKSKAVVRDQAKVSGLTSHRIIKNTMAFANTNTAIK